MDILTTSGNVFTAFESCAFVWRFIVFVTIQFAPAIFAASAALLAANKASSFCDFSHEQNKLQTNKIRIALKQNSTWRRKNKVSFDIFFLKGFLNVKFNSPTIISSIITATCIKRTAPKSGHINVATHRRTLQKRAIKWILPFRIYLHVQI